MPTLKAGAPPPGAGRVVAGTARGIRLAGAGEATRPLGDRLKQAVFAMLEPEIRGRPFLDAFAGTGAAGIEALSRGASGATFLELDRVALAAIERNLTATRLAGSTTAVTRVDAVEWLAAAGSIAAPFGVVFLDPPYDLPGLLRAALERIERAGRGVVLAADGIAVAKYDLRTAPPARIGLLASVRERRFGESAVTFYRWEAG